MSLRDRCLQILGGVFANTVGDHRLKMTIKQCQFSNDNYYTVDDSIVLCFYSFFHAVICVFIRVNDLQ